jgi:beta-glucanase (GH16 family)
MLASLCVLSLGVMGPKLVWSDEFGEASIDSSKWSFEVNADGGGNHELQYYTDRPANARIEHGRLVIEARKEHFTGPGGTREFTSARMVTKRKGDWNWLGLVRFRDDPQAEVSSKSIDPSKALLL